MYNFVIFGSNQDLYKMSFKDATAKRYVSYISSPYEYKKPFFNFLYKLHFSNRINKFINLPLKNIWNRYYFKNDFENDKPICFLFFHNWCELEKFGLIKYLKSKYPQSQMVCFFQDLVDLQINIDIERVKKTFDLVISFDKNDSNRYDLIYHPTVYSYNVVKKNISIKKSDFYFLGSAKKRFSKIVSIYEKLTEMGFICEFYVTNIRDDEKKDYQGLHYISNMTYEENLQHVLSTKCILEVMQENSTGHTMRIWEAIMYDKKMLTDNIQIKSTSFYNSSNILVIYNGENLEKHVGIFNNMSMKTDHNYKDKISPLKLLKFITKKLEQKY